MSSLYGTCQVCGEPLPSPASTAHQCHGRTTSGDSLVWAALDRLEQDHKLSESIVSGPATPAEEPSTDLQSMLDGLRKALNGMAQGVMSGTWAGKGPPPKIRTIYEGYFLAALSRYGDVERTTLAARAENTRLESEVSRLREALQKAEDELRVIRNLTDGTAALAGETLKSPPEEATAGMPAK